MQIEVTLVRTQFASIYSLVRNYRTILIMTLIFKNPGKFVFFLAYSVSVMNLLFCLLLNKLCIDLLMEWSLLVCLTAFWTKLIQIP